MSCWCTTSMFASTPSASTDSGASERTTSIAGPLTGCRPAGAATALAVGSAEGVPCFSRDSFSTSLRRPLASVCRSELRCACLRTMSVIEELVSGRRSWPRELMAAVVIMNPAKHTTRIDAPRRPRLVRGLAWSEEGSASGSSSTLRPGRGTALELEATVSGRELREAGRSVPGCSSWSSAMILPSISPSVPRARPQPTAVRQRLNCSCRSVSSCAVSSAVSDRRGRLPAPSNRQLGYPYHNVDLTF